MVEFDDTKLEKVLDFLDRYADRESNGVYVLEDAQDCILELQLKRICDLYARYQYGKVRVFQIGIGKIKHLEVNHAESRRLQKRFELQPENFDTLVHPARWKSRRKRWRNLPESSYDGDECQTSTDDEETKSEDPGFRQGIFGVQLDLVFHVEIQAFWQHVEKSIKQRKPLELHIVAASPLSICPGLVQEIINFLLPFHNAHLRQRAQQAIDAFI